MGGQANTEGIEGLSPQGRIFYDAEMGQYYTQAPQTTSRFGGSPNGLNVLGALGIGGNTSRTYLTGFGQSSPAMQQTAPYEYADVSLESLFPSMNQGVGNSALAGLLGGAPSATGSASSGAGRFM